MLKSGPEQTDGSPKPGNARLFDAEGESRDRRTAWIVSLTVHVVLLVLFALIRTGPVYSVPEWVQMEFVATNDKPRRAAPAPVKRRTVEPAAKKQPEAPPKVRLPERRMLEDTDPVLRVERTRDFDSGSTSRKAIERREQEQKGEFELPAPEFEGTNKDMAELPEITGGARKAEARIPDLGKGVDVPFIIEGEAANRVVLNKVIPEYPPGLTRQAVVKISFVVLPSGVVARTVPVLKGDAILEKIAMDAFRQWRFNALPENADAGPQQGVITFRFLLR